MEMNYRVYHIGYDWMCRDIYAVSKDFKRVFTGTLKQCNKWSDINILLPALEKLTDEL